MKYLTMQADNNVSSVGMKFLRENSLSIAMFTLFFLAFVGLLVSGYSYQNEQLRDHGKAAQSFGRYLTDGSFIEAIFENWESEFLQMGALVLLTIWFVQKGATESKELDEKDPVNAPSRYSIIRARTWKTRRKAIAEKLYSNSLTMALFALFIGSFVLHALSGTAAANQEAAWHGGEQQSVWSYAASSQFWFESFQNWQSEFLAVGVLLVLTIFLRQRYSPESKPVESSNNKTGG